MASGAKFTTRMHESRVMAQKAADRLYLDHEVAKEAAGVTHYEAVAARVNRRVGGKAVVRAGLPPGQRQGGGLQGRSADADAGVPGDTGAAVSPTLWAEDDIDSDEIDEMEQEIETARSKG